MSHADSSADSVNRKRKIPYHTESYLKQIKLLKKSRIKQDLHKLYQMN